MEYKGIKIYNKVIIVERTDITEGVYHYKGRTVNQGYVVDQSNKKMLETALNWASWTDYDEDLRREYLEAGRKFGYHSEEAKAAEAAYDASMKKIPGVVHEYDNGTFTIVLSESAEMSSQGGKLSFWNCIITAPDGKNFLIGINSELLLHLLMSTTLVNGVCQEKVWLGRVKGNQVGVFTENMEDFKQAKLDEEQRQTSKKGVTTYKPGDIVKTLTGKELYLGSVYKYYSFEQGYRYCDRYIVIYDKPKLVHIFRSFYEKWNTKEEVLSDNYDVRLTKPKRNVVGHIDLEEKPLSYIYKLHLKYKQDKLKDYATVRDEEKTKQFERRENWDYQKVLLMYGESDISNTDELKQKIIDAWASTPGYYRFEYEFKFLSEEQWRKEK